MLSPYEPACRPPLWARGGHFQTILAHLLPTSAPALALGRDGDTTTHAIDLTDGDRLRVLHRSGAGRVVVYLFHGLSGDAGVDYMRILAAAAQRLGFGVVAVNHRGCGDGRGLAAGIYHSGRADDIAAVVEWGRRRFPGQLHLAVGVSLSGNALLLLAGRRDFQPPDAAIAVNPPVDLASCARRIATGFNRVYDRRFVRRCTAMLAERQSDGLLRADLDLVRARSLRQFDDLFTAPLAGFADAEDYYRRCSSRDHLAAIEIPTLILTSADDPFVPSTDVESAPRSATVQLHVEPHGGHVGYLAVGRLFQPERWLGGAMQHYLRELAELEV